MDKRNTIIGILLIVTAFGLMIWQNKKSHEYQQSRASQNLQDASPVGVNFASPVVESSQELDFAKIVVKEQTQTSSLVSPHSSTSPVGSTSVLGSALSSSVDHEEQFFVLENNYIKAIFTSQGGAIEEIELKKHQFKKNNSIPFTFNYSSEVRPLSLSTTNNNQGHKEFAPSYRLVSKEDNSLTFAYLTNEGLEVIRTYKIAQPNSEQDPYVIRHETKFINKSDSVLSLKDIYVCIGTIPPVSNDPTGEFLNVGYYDNNDAEFISIKEFKGSNGFLGFNKKLPVSFVQRGANPLVWGSIKNQFFTTVLTGDKPGKGIFVTPYPFSDKQDGTVVGQVFGLYAGILYDIGDIAPQAEVIYGANLYAGPKEYARLEKLGNHQDLIMQFGLFGFISKLLLVMMVGIHKLIPNYGVAIIIVTVIIKLLLWPLTGASARSSRRMAKIQEPLKILRERYKDNPQKLQHETMKLFKDNKVNPAAGCLPILVQIPIFLGLFWMLRSASELRFAEFLWIKDLSRPDTILSIAGFPINFLPVLMGITMVIQMRITPTPSTDQFQAKIFQFMPFVFLAICYNFPAGLVLYWTVQNLLTIFQQYMMNKSLDDEENKMKSERLKRKLGKPKLNHSTS